MNKVKTICAAMLLAAIILIPAMAWAQAQVPTTGQSTTEPSFFVEGYLGAGFSSSTQKPNGNSVNGDYDSYFQGGLKLGYWFTPHGTHAASWYPEWMKYFGLYTDLSYHALNLRNNTITANGTPVAVGNSFGYVVTWSLMVSGRLGFMPDREVPFGRLQPYVAFGPALFFSGQDYNIGGFTGGTDGATNIGLAAETGIRYFLASNISAEASFKYRYFAPNYYFRPFGTNVQSNTNLFTGQVGLAYHF